MVRALSVTSSPVRPSPRVAACSRRPSRYTSASATLPILSSHRKCSSVPISRGHLGGPGRQLVGVEDVVQGTTSGPDVGRRELGGEPAPPTNWVGESGVRSSGVLILERLQPPQHAVEVGVR